MTSRHLVIAGLALLLAAPAAAKDRIIDRIDLASAYRADETAVVTTLFDPGDGPGLAVGEVESRVPTGQRILHFLKKDGSTKGKKVFLGSPQGTAEGLTEALRSAASATGLAAKRDQPAWTLDVSIRDVGIDYRVVFMGAILFYGHLEADVTLTSPSGERRDAVWRAHDQCVRVNGGLGFKDEVSECLAELFLRVGQDFVARAQRDAVRAPLSSEAEDLLAVDPVAWTTRELSAIHTLALTASEEATDLLLRLLPLETEESRRAEVIQGLGLSPVPDRAAPPLVAAYATEEDDGKFALLDALQAMGAPEAVELATKVAVREPDLAARRLAREIADRR